MIDSYGRSIPSSSQWPSSADGKGFGPLANWTHSLGLKFGIWHIRGAPVTSAQKQLPILGASNVTLDEIVWDPNHCPHSQHRWCNCTWDQQYLGIDVRHPQAQVYYQSLVDLYAEW